MNKTLPPLDVEWDKTEPREVSNSSLCAHRFILKGMRVAECRKCGLGLFLDSVEDFKKLQETYGNAN